MLFVTIPFSHRTRSSPVNAILARPLRSKTPQPVSSSENSAATPLRLPVSAWLSVIKLMAYLLIIQAGCGPIRVAAARYLLRNNYVLFSQEAPHEKIPRGRNSCLHLVFDLVAGAVRRAKGPGPF